MRTIYKGRCNAKGCLKNIRHNKFFCFHHWTKIQPGIKLSLIEFYMIGQDDPLSQVHATNTWLDLVAYAVDYLERFERSTTNP